MLFYIEWPPAIRDISRIIDHISSSPQDTPVQEVFSWLLAGPQLTVSRGPSTSSRSPILRPPKIDCLIAVLSPSPCALDTRDRNTLLTLCVTNYTGCRLENASGSSCARWSGQQVLRVGAIIIYTPQCCRSPWPLLVPQTRSARYGRRSFADSGPMTWNSCPAAIRKKHATFCCEFIRSIQDRECNPELFSNPGIRD